MNRWPRKPLGQITELYGGSTPSRENPAFWGGDIPWVTPTDLPTPNEGIAVVSHTKDRITKAGLDNSSATLVPKDSVLFSSRATIGKVAVAHMPLTTNQGFVNFVPRSEVTARFLAHALWVYREDIARLAGSTTFKEVSKSSLRKYRVPVPPLAEQARIVKLLDEADELRKLRVQADRRTAALLPSLFHEMFGDPFNKTTRRPSLPLGEIVSLGSGATPPKENPEFWNGRTPWVSPKDMKAQELTDAEDHVSASAFEKTNLQLIPEDTVLIVVRGMILAHTVPIRVCRASVAINQDMKALLPKQPIEAEVLRWSLQAQHAHLLNQVSTAGHGTKKLDSEKLRAVTIPVPPLTLQKEFAQRVTEIRGLEAEQAASRRHLDDLFQSLLHRAFEGEL